MKRDAFDHEAYVRVIIHDRKKTERAKKTFYRLPIQPDEFIESIYFDPRADDSFVKMCTYYLKESLKFQGGIWKSALYRVRDTIVIE